MEATHQGELVLTRYRGRIASFVLLAVASAPIFQASAQQEVPAAPAQQPATPSPAAAPVFPKPNPADFTASVPTKETVNGFLQASWGYDSDRIWQVQGIMKTQVDGISKVVVLIGDKSGKQKPAIFQFYALPDGKHLIAGDDIYPFGDHPYAGSRAILQQEANGPYRGSASKDLELVEFADFQCPHCKEAQANMDKLVADFPNARVVFQSFPLERIHPQAKLAAEYGDCVAKQGGSPAFFQFVSAVFEGQDGLATADGATLTLNSAVTKAGLDPAKIAACAVTPATSDAVEKSVKLALDLNVDQTPVLMINGRMIPVSAVPYDVLKKIIEFQARQDGIAK